MSAGTQEVGQGSPGKAGKYALMVGGHVAALAIGAFAFQMFRPEPAFPDQQAGRATVGAAEAAPTKRYAARVNGELISWDEVADETMSRYGKEILDNLVNRKIIEQACKKHGTEVSAEEVRQEVTRISKKFNLSVEQWISMLQSERKITAEQYYRDIIWPMLALKKLAGTDVQVTAQEVEKAYIRNFGPRVKARILVLNNGRRANEVWAKCKRNPESFEKLVMEFSDDPASRPLGGSIPPIRRYSGSEAVEKAAFELKDGEISSVVQISDTQWVIIKCEGRTEPIVENKQEQLPILKEELREEKAQEAIAKTFEKLRAGSRIDNYLSNESTGVRQQARTAPAGAVQPAGARAPAAAAGTANPVRQAGGTRPAAEPRAASRE